MPLDASSGNTNESERASQWDEMEEHNTKETNELPDLLEEIRDASNLKVVAVGIWQVLRN